MTHQTLTDPLVERYAVAVASRLPADQRDDVAAELRASILDSVEDRLDHAPNAARDAVVREVLADLGDPAKLSREYTTTPRHLIGPAVYDAWWCLLRTLLVVVVPIIVVLAVVGGIWADDESLAAILVSGVGAGFAVGVQICFWVTGTFWLVERFGGETGELDEPWSVDRLPALPRPRQVDVPDLVWGVGFQALVLAWLPWQHFRSPVEDANGQQVPILDPALWSSGGLWGFALLLVVGIVVEVVKYVVGSWTLPVTVASVALDLVMTGFLVALMTTQQVVNPALLARAGDPAATDDVVDRIVVVVALVVAALGIVDAVRKHLRHRRDRSVTPAVSGA